MRDERDVREVVDRIEQRSEAVVVVDWTDVRAECGRERGGDVMGNGGGTRRVLGAEPLPDGVSARMGEGGILEEGEEPREARLLAAEPRCWDGGRCGSLGGRGGGGGFEATETAGFMGSVGGRGGSVRGGRKDEGADTFSKDSSRLSPSSVLATVHSRSMENACRGPTPWAVGSPPSEDRETEWKDETDEAGAWP